MSGLTPLSLFASGAACCLPPLRLPTLKLASTSAVSCCTSACEHTAYVCAPAGGLHSQDEGNTLLKEDDSLLRHTFFSILRDHHPSIAAKVGLAGLTAHQLLASLQTGCGFNSDIST